MITINNLETFITQDKMWYGSFLIEPLQIGQGITVGNTLRRTLLADLVGFSITGLRINNIKHEFSYIEGVREDILELILNLKEIIFKSSFFILEENKYLKYKAFLNVKGPIIITAGMFKLPRMDFKIMNPHQYIGTIINNSELYLEIDIENNIGYKIIEEKTQECINDNIFLFKPTTIVIDSNFIPIKKVNYKVKLIYDTYGNIKESLFLEITTNGSLSPNRSFQETIKIILNLFYPLLINSNFLLISSILIDKINFN